MSRFVLFEDAGFAGLLPTVYWRSVFELRCGRGTLLDLTARALPRPPAALWTRVWIADVAAERTGLPLNGPVAPGDVLVNGRWVFEGPLEFRPPPFLGTCENAIAYISCDAALAQQLGPKDFLDRSQWPALLESVPSERVAGRMINYPWDLLSINADLLMRDWDASRAVVEGEVDAGAVLLNRGAISIARGARVMPLAVLDAGEGPVVLEEGVVVRPQACVTGPVHLGRNCVVHPHAHVHGGSSLGPVCKVGGEIDGCVIQGYTNKAHSGFLGHAFIASWNNLGAGTVNSDLKNTYGTIRVPINGRDVDSGQMFFGAVFGDHVKTGIQQSLPTGTVVGFAANVASSRMLPRFVRSFTWLTDRAVEEGDASRLMHTAAVAMERRHQKMTAAEQALFGKLPEIVAFFEPDTLGHEVKYEASDTLEAAPLSRYDGPSRR